MNRDSSRHHTTRTAVWLLVGALLALPLASARAVTPGQKCAIAKNKAAVKKLGAKLKCHQKAMSTGATVDPICLTTAETKFDQRMAKAELAGGCAVNGDAGTIEFAVDFCVTSLVNLTPTSVEPSGVCCVGSSGTYCSMTTTNDSCTGQNGTVGPGVCRNDGYCGTATGPGDCCDTNGGCVVVVNGLTAFTCQSPDTFSNSATCTPTGCQ